MQVAVVTPHHRERRAQLERCIASVAAQTYPATHFLVADGASQDWVQTATGASIRHVGLDRARGDFGNTPRAIGGILAASEGFDAVCFLDADNWFEPDHVQVCLKTGLNAAEPVDYLVARRRLTRADGSVLPIVTDDDARLEHVDANCFFLFWGAFHTLGRWGVMPKPLSPVVERVYLAWLRAAGLRFAITGHATVNYLCTWTSVFEAIGEAPPEYAKPNVNLAPTVNWWSRLNQRDRDVVNRLAGAALWKLLADHDFESVLDIGGGAGEHSEIFLAFGKSVTTVDYGKSVYFAQARPGLDTVIGDFNALDFAHQFDCVWASHVLEHQLNVNLFLRKVHAALREGGVLAVTVPPAKGQIVGGHVSVWNAGLLLYNLVLAGFDCSAASVLRYGYDISVVLIKRTVPLPADLAFDSGDIRKLRRFLPAQLAFHSNALDDPFDGDVERLNW